jgi:H+/Cl- antiporter ClcA
MPQPKPINPFYSVLIVVGIVFAITACAYGVMTVRGLDPRNADEGGLIGVMDDYGIWILVGELLLLGLLTMAAIGTDEYWTRRMEASQSRDSETTPPPV